MRLKAGVALSYLIDIHMRPDPLFNELANGIKNADEGAVRDTYLQVRLFKVSQFGTYLKVAFSRKGILFRFFLRFSSFFRGKMDEKQAKNAHFFMKL